MESSELTPSEIDRLYHSYSNKEKGECMEQCAFRATCQILSTLLEVEPTQSTMRSGDELALYRRPSDEVNHWVVRRIAPARNRRFSDEERSLQYMPDFAVLCNDKLVIAIEVKNWNPNRRWRPNEVIAQIPVRFIGISLTVPCVLLTTSDKFPEGIRRILEGLFRFKVRLVHNLPLPCFDLNRCTEEMRRILEEFITLDRLTQGSWDSP